MAGRLPLMDDSAGESDAELTVNKDYADRYNNWRRLEEMQKLKDLKKEGVSEESSSSSDEEIEPAMEKDFFRTLSLIKAKDPRVYDREYQFFKDDSPPMKAPRPKKEKPMLMKEYTRKVILERNGEVTDEEEEEGKRSSFRTPLQEEQELKESFKAALQDDSEDEDLLQVRGKSAADEEQEEVEYKKWLETDEDMQHLNKEWSDPKLDANEKFLRDYFLNEWYLERNKEGVPTHSEVLEEGPSLSDDERILEEQERFEHGYNFRYEEPGAALIERHPRRVQDSLRTTESKRKLKRQEHAERKKREKELKREELKRLKALKRKEIEERFLKLREAAGLEDQDLDHGDVEDDFDPDSHDQKMGKLFGDDYYTVEETRKPEFEYDDEIDGERWDEWTRDNEHQDHPRPRQSLPEHPEEEDGIEERQEQVRTTREDFVQDMIDSASSRKKRAQKKSLFAQIMSQPKPLYDADGKSFEEYLDEYYKLDYEDIVGDQPVRYKYRKVIPNDFGLTVDEILTADDKELNRWCSIKKTFQYRRDDEELNDLQGYRSKGKLLKVKQKILPSLFAPPKEEAEENQKAEETKKKRRKKKKGEWKLQREQQQADKKTEEVEGDAEIEETDEAGETVQVEETEEVGSKSVRVEPTEEETKKKRKRKRKKKDKNEQDKKENSECDDTVDADNESTPLEATENNTAAASSNETSTPTKKKKRLGAVSDERLSLKIVENGIEKDSTHEISPSKNRRKHSVSVSDESPSLGIGVRKATSSQVSPSILQKLHSICGDKSTSYGTTENGTTESTPKRKKKRPGVVGEDVDVDLGGGTTSQVDNDTSGTPQKKKRSTRVSENGAEEGNENPDDATAGPVSDDPFSIFMKAKKQSAKETSELPGSKKLKQDSTGAGAQGTIPSNEGGGEEHRMKRKRPKKKKKKRPDDGRRFLNRQPRSNEPKDKRLTVSCDRLAAFGINPVKFKNSIIYGKK